MTNEELKLMISKIISESIRQPIFSPLALSLLNYDFVLTEKVPLNAPACVVYKEHKIYINPKSDLFLSIKRYSENERYKIGLSVILFHESLHPLLGHNKRAGSRDPQYWNIACDILISNLLKDLQTECSAQNLKKYGSDAKNYFNICVDAFSDKWFKTYPKYQGMLEEEIYNDLVKNKEGNKQETKKYDPKQMKDFLDGKQEQQPQEKQSDSNDQGDECTVSSATVDGKEFKIIKFPEFDPRKPEEKELQEKENNTIEFCKNHIRQNLSRGFVSQKLKELLGKLLEVKIDWTRILKDSLLTALEDKITYDWGMPVDEFLANPFELPYLPERTEDYSKGIIVIVRDMSGSMPDDIINKASNIVWQARNHYKAILLIDHDVEVSNIKYYQNVNDMTNNDLNQILVRSACGGTSHKYAFDEIVKFIKEHPDDKISVVISITDLCSDLATTQNILPKSLPRIWLSSSSYQVPGLLGRVIRVS